MAQVYRNVSVKKISNVKIMDLERGVETIQEALESLAPVLRPAIPFFLEPPVEVLCRLWQTNKVKKWAEEVLRSTTKCTLSNKPLGKERYLHLVWEPDIKTQKVQLLGYHVISMDTKKVLDLKTLMSESAKMLAPTNKRNHGDINEELCHFLEVNQLNPKVDVHRFHDTISASYSLHILLKQVIKWEPAKIKNDDMLSDLVIAPITTNKKRKRELNSAAEASSTKRLKDESSQSVSPKKSKKEKKDKKLKKEKKENKTQKEVNI